MTSPGIWKVVGGCSSDFSSSYGTGGDGTIGPSGGYPTHYRQAQRRKRARISSGRSE